MIVDALNTIQATAVLPELLLALSALLLLMIGVFTPRHSVEIVNTLALAALAIAAALVIWMPEGKIAAFGGAFIVDSFARVMKVLTLFASAVALVLSNHYMR